jgi:hypothetical protein
MVLHVPAVAHQRYYSFEFMDPYLNVFRYVGTRTTGEGAGNYAIVGPSWKGKLPAGVHRINAAYDQVWILGRTLVNSQADLASAHKVQKGYKLVPLKWFKRVGLAYKPHRPNQVITTPTIPTIPTGLAFYDALGNALAEFPPPARDSKVLSEMATAGIGAGLQPSTENLAAATVQGLQAADATAPAAVRSMFFANALGGARGNNGWYVPPSDLGNFGTDYKLRASIATSGLAANRPAEAIYGICVLDNSGTPLNGSHSYQLHFAANQLPPAKYFWSFSVYNSKSLLVANPYNRYSLGSYSPLKYNKDGSLDIYLSPTPPAAHQSNWLPTPPNTLLLTGLRLYGPKPSALNHTYPYPVMQRIG